MSVLDRIRAKTAPLHVRLEAELTIIERLVDPMRRRALLRAYYDLYAGAEPMLEAWLADTSGLDFHTRRKTDILRHDLDKLGETLPSYTNAKAVANAPNQPFAFGFAYVLEGATLGARVIRKQCAALGCTLDGLEFFNGYGAATPQRWKEFCAVLERDCAHSPRDAEYGAVQGFSHVRRSLREASGSTHR